MKTIIFNPTSGNTYVSPEPCQPETYWLHEIDAPIIIEDRTVTFKPDKMIENYQYHFEYGDETLIAVKPEKGVLNIYEET